MLKIKLLNKKDLAKAMELLDNELGEERVRDRHSYIINLRNFSNSF